MKKDKPLLLVVLNTINIFFGLWITLSSLVLKTMDNRMNLLTGGIISL